MPSRCSLSRICEFIIAALVTVAAAGCASVAPLDDVALGEVKLATAEDMVRLAQALELRSRENFEGASFSDGKGNILASFSAAEYDKYLAYVRAHDVSGRGSGSYLKPQWPIVRLSFQSRRVLFDPGASSMPSIVFYLCDIKRDEGRLWGFGMPELMWRGRFVTRKRALDIKKLLEDEARPQHYEVFFNYVHWRREQARQKEESVTLLPLSTDLCIALHRYNYPFPASVGPPLRIEKDMINSAVGPLPRLVYFRQKI